MRLDHLLSREKAAQVAERSDAAPRHDSGVKDLSPGVRRGAAPYQVQIGKRTVRERPVRRGVGSRAHQAFRQGRQKEHTEDASPLRADEGRGNAAKSVGEPRAGCDPTMSEWGNPSVIRTPRNAEGTGGTETS